MEIGVLDLASRIVAHTASRGRLARYRAAAAALHAARNAAQDCETSARLMPRDLALSERDRGDVASTLPAALAAIFDMADLVGVNLGSFVRAAVAAAAQMESGTEHVEPLRGPEKAEMEHLDRQTDSGSPLVDPREPAFVDGHPWTMEDDIAAELLLAGDHAAVALSKASEFMKLRNAWRAAAGRGSAKNAEPQPNAPRNGVAP